MCALPTVAESDEPPTEPVMSERFSHGVTLRVHIAMEILARRGELG